MEKYLGNKATLLPLIDSFFKTRIPHATRISDVFAGTNNVSRYFSGRGWSTAACDSNRFSYVLAQAYLGTSAPPTFESLKGVRADEFRLRRVKNDFDRAMSRYGNLYLPNRKSDEIFNDLSSLAHVLVNLQTLGEGNAKPGVITDCYTQWGTRASFLSRRGTRGIRNYFSQSNALFLDGVLNAIREWWSLGYLTRNEIFLLLTSILEEVVITANVNGTFHDFNRTRLWPNANQAFQLRLPLVSCAPSGVEIANADALDAARTFAGHDICYLDPPYNFRQYSAYYHFLNFIAAFPFLEDVETYMSGLAHVRGQHPSDDFASDFCYRSRFIGSLRQLVESVDAEHVVLSYYGGRNHWNHWSAVSEPTDEGLHELRGLFEDSTLFSASEVVPALEIRKNYQSRVGEQKELVNEYLFHGVRQAKSVRKDPPPLPNLNANVHWGLVSEFGHTHTVINDGIDQSVRTFG